MVRRIFTIASFLLCITSLYYWLASWQQPALLVFHSGRVVYNLDASARAQLVFHFRGRSYALTSSEGRLLVDNRGDYFKLYSDTVREYAALVDSAAPGDPSVDMRAREVWLKLGTTGPPKLVEYISVPCWSAFALTAILPALAFGRWLRREIRIYMRRCGECGYDLRASKDRCPECGAAVFVR